MQDTDYLYEAAKIYRDAGLNVIPCTDEKRPVGEWSEFQNRLLTNEEFRDRLNGHAYGLGIICGRASGNLEAVDIDVKYDLNKSTEASIAVRYFAAIPEDLHEKIYITRTVSGGYHIWYRCEKIQGNQKLARRYSTEEELQINPKEKIKVLIETRGYGGFIVAPPTPGYTVESPNKKINLITAEERDFLIELGRSFNEVYEVQQHRQTHQFDKEKSPYELTPWEDYNERADVIQLLEDHQWGVDYKKGGRIFLTRPGKTKGCSADYNSELRLFKCFSTSVSGFEPEKAYSPTAVFSILECNGDYSKATEELEKMGYGKRKPENEKVKSKEPERKEIRTLEDFDHILITKEKSIPQEEPVITVCGAAFVAAHNISTLAAQAKGGKTAIMNAMVAGSCSEDGEIEGFPDIKVKANTERKAVIVFDTEQSEADQQYNLNTILKRCKLDQTPDYLRCYNIRKLDFKTYRSATERICELLKEKFGGIHSIYVDGGADYIASVNDEDQSTEIIQFFIHLSINYDCPVIIIVHQNPGGEKERGHFGSTIQRKCYGLLSIAKEGEIFTLQPKMMRRSGTADVPLIHFKYDKEAGYHVQTEQQDKETIKNEKDRERLKEVSEKVFGGQRAYRHKDAVSEIMKVTSRKMSTAKTMLENMEGFGFIIQGNDKNYRQNG